MYNVNAYGAQGSLRVLLATPSYDRNVTHTYSSALTETCCALRAKNIVVNSSLLVASSLLCKTRNTILSMFLESDATHLLCVDADLGWPAEAVESMLQANKDIICGVYPARSEASEQKNSYIYVPELDADNMCTTDRHLIKALYVPAGFMLIKREAIERMVAKFPERYVETFSNADKVAKKLHVFFNTEIYDGMYWGEDYIFCRLAREAGNEIWVDPTIQFNHAGRVGRLVDELTFGRSKEEVEEKLRLKLVNNPQAPKPAQQPHPQIEELTFNVKRS